MNLNYLKKKNLKVISEILRAPRRSEKSVVLGNVTYRKWVRKHFAIDEDTGQVVSKKSRKAVCAVEDMYNVILKAHLKCGHGGINKTAEVVVKNYSGIGQLVVDAFVRKCEVCNKRRKGNVAPRGSAADPPRAVVNINQSSVYTISIFQITTGLQANIPTHLLQIFCRSSNQYHVYPLRSVGTNEVASNLTFVFLQLDVPLHQEVISVKKLMLDITQIIWNRK